MADDPPIEEQPAKKQEGPNNVPTEESRAAKRPLAADYFDQDDEFAPTKIEEPLVKKQRIASLEAHNPNNVDHIRNSNMDVYISARKSMTV
jgi:hypothetical protein